MSSVRLTVRRKDGVEVAVLEHRDDGTIFIVRSTNRVRPDLERWLRQGLSEFVGTPGDRRPRKTPSGDPALLDRIAERFRGYGFETYAVLTQSAPEGWARSLKPARVDVRAGVSVANRAGSIPLVA